MKLRNKGKGDELKEVVCGEIWFGKVIIGCCKENIRNIVLRFTSFVLK